MTASTREVAGRSGAAGRRRAARGATIDDVARDAGVSVMTVSRVINGRDRVADSTRSLVQSSIERLAYVPSAAARSLAAANEVRIALLYDEPRTAYLAPLVLGALDQANRHNLQLHVRQCGAGAAALPLLEELVQRPVQGALLLSPLSHCPEILRFLGEHGVEVLGLAETEGPRDAPSVSIDNYGAAYAMTSHLVGLGHRRIGFIGGTGTHSASNRRLDGYRAALREHAIDTDARLEVDGRFSYQSGLDAAEALLALDPAPTAIFASNDDMAAAAVATAHRHHLDVPADLTIVGFDDTMMATAIWPQLTTIHQPIEEMARTGVDLLLRRIRGDRAKAARHVVLDHALVRRQSDAPPRGRPRSA